MIPLPNSSAFACGRGPLKTCETSAKVSSAITPNLVTLIVERRARRRRRMPPKKQLPLCEVANGTAELLDGTVLPWRLSGQKVIVIGTTAPRITIKLSKEETAADAQRRVEEKLGIRPVSTGMLADDLKPDDLL